MKVESVTEGLVIGLTIVALAWDVYAALSRQPGATISEVLRTQAASHPVIPFALGFLMAHLFFVPTK